MSPSEDEAVINHLTLPPRLAGSKDGNLNRIGQNIIARLLEACVVVEKSAAPEIASGLRAPHRSLQLCAHVNQGSLEKCALLEKFQHLQSGVVLILHLVAQNAALLIYCDTEDEGVKVIFEAFEASPRARDVLESKSALKWNFPGRCARIALDDLEDASFQESLADFLEKASTESLKRFAAKASKANSLVVEERDTCDPALITQMLIPLLEGMGESIDPPRFCKRVRDDAIHASGLPWRRLPFWLVLRVAARRILARSLGNEIGRATYKFVICAVLSELLRDSAGSLRPEFTLHVRAKLCRRLAKLEEEKNRATGELRGVLSRLFETMRPGLLKTIRHANKQVTNAWEGHKEKITRKIPRLESRASPALFALSLPNSKQYLNQVLGFRPSQTGVVPSLRSPNLDETATGKSDVFAKRCFELAALDISIEGADKSTPTAAAACEQRCIAEARTLQSMFSDVRGAYLADPEQMSCFILNVFETWMVMDKCAAAACPLLLQYHPFFIPQILDILHIPAYKDMERLRTIQDYIAGRCRSCRYATNTVFGDPDNHCFAQRFIADYDRDRVVAKLLDKIKSASQTAMRMKQDEYRQKCDQYDEHTDAMSRQCCECRFLADGTIDITRCTKCFHRRRRNRMTVDIHEDYLPSTSWERAAVVFELAVPDYIAAYRDATLDIITTLRGERVATPSKKPSTSLQTYENLARFTASSWSCMTLASVEKSFLDTHYRTVKMKASLDNVLKPLGLRFAYYSRGMWLRDVLTQPLRLDHLCAVRIPKELATALSTHDHRGRTSYEIVASQPECPSNMSRHEFMAYQRLYNSTNTRWLTMLVELGASNINFSTEATMHLFSDLAVQAGPATNLDNAFRDIHVAFKDESFCERLAQLISRRLDNILSNWREAHCMEMIINLAFRLFDLTSGPTHQSAIAILKKTRRTTLRWVRRLRHHVRTATDRDSATISSQYGLWAALLCRRACAILLATREADTESFIEASIALQENIGADIQKLPVVLKNMLVRDMKMVHRLSEPLHRTVLADVGIVWSTITNSLDNPEPSADWSYSTFHAPQELHPWLIFVTEPTTETSSQIIHYDYQQGHLLINGQCLNRPPIEITESVDVKELFGTQQLVTIPSCLRGMTYKLTASPPGHQIHFGLHDKQVIIRDRSRGSIFQYIPRHVFRSRDSFDLPAPLIDDAIHWLNVDKGQLEIRRLTNRWNTGYGDWILNLRTKEARRRGSRLIDPHSSVFQKVVHIFRDFESPHMILMYQPATRPLHVDLRRLGLSFEVNEGNMMLRCHELGAEIDANQNAGTLYGLESKIVLRDSRNRTRWSIIVPLGDLDSEPRGMHVSVRAQNDGTYGHFIIDEVLGRLSCAPDPLLLYAKARFHALTSFCLPDPLTGRTGREEAMHCLCSANCQPSVPLTEAQLRILDSVKRLAPGREYYPENKRMLQSVSWNSNLTVSIQHDGYEAIVNKILEKSNVLRPFFSHVSEETCLEEESHLRKRAESQRMAYERHLDFLVPREKVRDMDYEPRDCHISINQAKAVYSTVRRLRDLSLEVMRPVGKLDIMLQNWDDIGGFHDPEPPAACLEDMMGSFVHQHWGSLVNMCRMSRDGKQSHVLFHLALLAFSEKPTTVDMVRVLVAFTRLEGLKRLDLPNVSSSGRFRIKKDQVTTGNFLPFIATTYPDYVKRTCDWPCDQENHRAAHEEAGQWKEEGRSLAKFLVDQLPTESLVLEGFIAQKLDLNVVMEAVRPEWDRLVDNRRLLTYIAQVQKILDTVPSSLTDRLAPRFWRSDCDVQGSEPHSLFLPSLSRHLLCKVGIDASDEHSIVLGQPEFNSRQHFGDFSGKAADRGEYAELEEILESFVASEDPLRQQYGVDLMQSLRVLERLPADLKIEGPEATHEDHRRAVAEAKLQCIFQVEVIRAALKDGHEALLWLDAGDLWPCMSTTSLLEQIRSTAQRSFGKGMKEAIVEYGCLLTSLQRTCRIHAAIGEGDPSREEEELANAGHSNWNPMEFPDWLLLELDSDILIREQQFEVAQATISPASEHNAVLQMNMGKGKTSCIMPMAVSMLANRKNLCRVIVPKSLLFQTLQSLQARLGGLVGREIRQIPFSRKSPTTDRALQLYITQHEKMRVAGGIALCAPEYILSHKLSGLQHLVDCKNESGIAMVDFQSWISRHCRDILDESDFTLAVKTQLIYPSGSQNSVDGHPHRWYGVQSILALVEDRIHSLSLRYPESIEVIPRSGGYPIIHLLQPDIERCLEEEIAQDICDGRTPMFRVEDGASEEARGNIKAALTDSGADPELVKKAAGAFANETAAVDLLLLARGLLLRGVLSVCLKKRWNVQYGLHPSRDPIAVPYEAKGVPSEQAEWGHPDVAIILTCLAFYYSGLNKSQFMDGLQRVLTSDDPAAEYDRWIYTCHTLPEHLRHWNMINVDDGDQLGEMWEHLRFDRTVLNHFMNHFVFPAHVKQFSVKLQLSGWDVPLFDASSGNAQVARTTGFSGTNDNKMLLPLTIQQGDLPTFAHTNAEVLTYLLQERNRRYMVAAHDSGRRFSEDDLLKLLASEGIRVLIDAGANILEMRNQDVAAAWLAHDTGARAAVFFAPDHQPQVLFRDKRAKSAPLVRTPFAKSLDHCVVYIDEAHTRGTDLKLPRSIRGALTLGLGQTKDHTVQAAMRLRQLGSTQSVVFVAPLEVHRSIRSFCGIGGPGMIESPHVVRWLLEQTCLGNQNLQHLYLAQGADFLRRQHASNEYPNFLSNRYQLKKYLGLIRTEDIQTLEQMYSGVGTGPSQSAEPCYSRQLKLIADALWQKREERTTIVADTCYSALDEVEQEREVEFQVEEVRQVQKQPSFDALEFPGLHDAIRHFAETGELTRKVGFLDAFDAVKTTRTGTKFGVRGTSSTLFVSAEFMKTIDASAQSPNDNFLRPIEWMLYCPAKALGLVIITEEAELLIPLLRSATKPATHLVTYSAPITRDMAVFNDLAYYALPRLPTGHTPPTRLTIELGILAGRLYFNFEEYDDLRHYFDRKTMSNERGLLTEHPFSFMLDWLSVRRHGQDVMHTPMGYLCHARPLTREHHFFANRVTAAENCVVAPTGGARGNAFESDNAAEGWVSDEASEWDGECGGVEEDETPN